MKKQLLLLLLLSFIYQNTSSFWILTSFYINQRYIAENICINRFDAIPMCYGSCYLQSELSEDSEKKTEFPIFKTKEVQPLFSQSMAYQPDVVHPIILENIPYPNYMDTLVISNFIYAVFQPPEWV
ncbi:hypothetical protein QNH98_19610 [Myroides sp. mNGS23_01]|nr:hypothetical protein [Myroides sp. mNGS23_01]WHT39117.1 hypothetical protein QNH98_19610 [Myroides sp. mNGS23_01]